MFGAMTGIFFLGVLVLMLVGWLVPLIVGIRRLRKHTGGAVLTVVQLQLFREGITAGRGWIAVALVIFARWRPGLALVGALLFGLADALQFRIQVFSQVERGSGAIPYEFLLMLPYVLTLLALLYRRGRGDAPAALGRPYSEETH